MIPQQTIDAILAAIQIENYIGKEIELKPSGVNRKGCCPFHDEKTPSFVVSPTKGIFKCYGCGEGGNVIGWVMKRNRMTFPEAVKTLAKELNIPIEERESTPQEIEANFKRESVIAANEAANKFYVEQLVQTSQAMEYCVKRWGKDAVRDMELGYAPNSWTAVMDHLLAKQYTTEVLNEAGLISLSEKTKGYYDFFRDRITIPIRNKNGQIVGFTARIIKEDPNKKEGKFINTRDTVVFSKSKNLFGIHHAYREAYKQDKIVLVEGAPDVIKLQSIGVVNSVAPLGTALTTDQIKLIKSCARNVMMIPDTDKAGTDAARKNGVELFKAGVNVSILQITDGKDADEAFDNRQDYLEATEGYCHYDFIKWITALMIAEAGQSESSKAEKIGEICSILASCNDDNTVDMYIESLSKEVKPKKVWVSKLAEARSKIQAATQVKKHVNNDETFQRFGFSVENNCYYGQTQRGTQLKWSNFIMKPLAHVRGMNSKRLYVITNEYGHEQTIEIKQEDLVSLNRFRVKTEGMGNYIWEASEMELHKLKRYLYENTITCDEITQLGWQKKYGFYAWGNGGVVDGQFLKTDKIGILKIGDNHYYQPAFSKIFDNDPQLFQFERKFVHIQANGISLYDYTEKLIAVFGDNAKIALCFLLATLFKDIVTKHTKSFPILNLFGPKGTGKSELGHSLMSFFISKNIPPNINNTTIPALAEAVAQVSNAVVHIDEYKNTIDLDRREFLKGLWDGAGRTRMNMDRDKKRETTTVDSGIVLSGQEMPTADIALFSRLIFLTFNKTTFEPSERLAFEELKRIEDRGLSHLTNEILRYRKQVEVSYSNDWNDTAEILSDRLKSHLIEDRTFKNWVTVATAARTLCPHLHMAFTADEVLEIAYQGIIDQNTKTGENNELSGFWETIESLVRGVQIIKDVDFKIKGQAEVSMAGYDKKVALDPTKRYLLMSFNNVQPGYSKECKSTGSKVLPKDSLKYYLENSKEYIGTKRAERFKRLQNPHSGYVKALSQPEGTPTQYAYVVTTAMVFDYDMIQERYNIAIDEFSSAEEYESDGNVGGTADVGGNSKPDLFESEVPY